jgi:protocatechuate 3,4-dioxygenase beta subunit
MTVRGTIRVLLVIAACGSAFASLPVAAHTNRNARVVMTATVRDVALQSDNVLQGHVVDEEGMPQADYEVWIAPDRGQAIKIKTDASGRFSVPSMVPGLYRIDTPCGGAQYRVWDAKNAPNSAPDHVLLVVCARLRG